MLDNLTRKDRERIRKIARGPFDAWMRQVDAVLIARAGLDHRDLPDRDWRADYDAAACARKAVIAAIKELTEWV